jgi:hypothetical protein
VPATKPKARADLAVYSFGDELIAYDPTTGNVHHMNPLAALVFQLCDGSATVKETAVELADAINVPLEQVEPEVRAIVRQQRKQGLFERKRKAPDEGPKQDGDEADQRERVRMNVPRST